jgi:hypothetical protein
LQRGNNDFKNGHKPGTDTVNKEKGDLVFYQLFNAHGDNDIRPREICTNEPMVPDPNYFDSEIAVEKIKRHKSPGTDQIPAELIKAGGKTMF